MDTGTTRGIENASTYEDRCSTGRILLNLPDLRAARALRLYLGAS